MGSVWERLTAPRTPRSPQAPVASTSAGPSPSDQQGVGLYADFTDCLEEHKGHAMFGIAAVTIPISLYRQSVAPVVIGAILSIVPDILYANWRCDDKYRLFKRHLDATMKSQGLSAPQREGSRSVG